MPQELNKYTKEDAEFYNKWYSLFNKRFHDESIKLKKRGFTPKAIIFYDEAYHQGLINYINFSSINNYYCDDISEYFGCKVYICLEDGLFNKWFTLAGEKVKYNQ